MIDDALVLVAALGTEVLDGQVADRHVGRVAAEGVVVRMFTVVDGPWSADKLRAGAGKDLRVLVHADRVDTGREPVRDIWLAEIDAVVVPGRDLNGIRGYRG